MKKSNKTTERNKLEPTKISTPTQEVRINKDYSEEGQVYLPKSTWKWQNYSGIDEINPISYMKT